MITTGRLKLIVVASWAAFFVWLLWSGQVYRYIGPRTYWVIIFGAISLTLVSLAHLLPKVRGEAAPSSPGQLIGAIAMLVPIILVVVIPKPSLGSLAASRKLSGGLVSASGLQLLPPGGDVDISFQEVTYASESEKYAAAVGIVDGYELSLTGFVSTGPDGPEGTFPLTRFSIFCCAADVVPYTVRVRPPEGETGFDTDTWVRAEGVLVQEGGTWVLQAESLERVDEPSNPYI